MTSTRRLCLHLHLDVDGKCDVLAFGGGGGGGDEAGATPLAAASWDAFERPIQLRGGTTLWRGLDASPLLYLSSARPSNLAGGVLQSLRTVGDRRLPTQLVQSALQKAVRRGHVELARRYAKTLLCADVTAFLRRLPIVVVEDAVCVDDRLLLTAVWLMCASTRGFVMDARLRDLMVDLCARAAASPRIERLDKVKKWTQYACPLDTRRPQPVVAALLIRASYGGMSGDIAMLAALAQRWAQRLAAPDAYWRDQLADATWPEAHPPDWWERIRACKSRADILPEAVDFHVFRGVYFTMFRHESATLNVTVVPDDACLSRALWVNRSGVYASRKSYWTTFDEPLRPHETPVDACAHRRAKREETVDVWSQIAPTVVAVARRVLDPHNGAAYVRRFINATRSRDESPPPARKRRAKQKKAHRPASSLQRFLVTVGSTSADE